MDGITPDYCNSASISIGGSQCNVQTCDDNNCIQCLTTAVSTFVEVFLEIPVKIVPSGVINMPYFIYLIVLWQ